MEQTERTRYGSEIIGIVLFIATVLALWRFIDWGVGDLDEYESRYANCVEAEHSLGDSIYAERPDCRELLESERP